MCINHSSRFNPAIHLNYTGDKTIIDDGDGNYRIKFTSSGTLTFLRPPGALDLFMVGGGGGGGRNSGGDEYSRGGGGGGGHVFIASDFAVTVGVGYPIVIGPGGGGRSGSNGDGSSGSPSTAFGNNANGGEGGFENGDGGAGGSGGGGTAAFGGGDGEDGTNNNDTGAGIYNWGGVGDGVTTKEFGDVTGDQYADGGNGYAPTHGTDPGGLTGNNSGRGGDGGYTTGYEAEDGMAGIVIIRNHR